jgi:hypothetical protein
VGKIIINSPTSTTDYKGTGLLNLIITQFDNIIQFRIAQIPTNSTTSFEQYDLSGILNNSEIVLIFKSDTESVEKYIYNEADNDYQHGIINFKIVENDLSVLKKIYDKGYINFYLTILSNKVKTLLYSGTFTFYEDITFVDSASSTVSSSAEITAIEPPSPTVTTNNTTTKTNDDWPKAGKTIIIYTKYKNTSN